MAKGKTSKLRQLIPKSYHFDGYNEINCPNSRDKPFWSENTINMGDHHLNIHLTNSQMLTLQFSSVCPGEIIFEPYSMSIDAFATLLKKAINEGRDFITLEIKVDYNCSELHCKSCSQKSSDCHHILSHRPSIIMAAVSFYPNDIKMSLEHYYEIADKNNKNNGGFTMKPNKKFFGMNFEFGMSKDPNIRSTLMGVSVRNPSNGNWYVFDPANRTRKNMAGMKFGEFPVMLIPAQTVNVGELIKYDGKYHFVDTVSDKTLHLIGAADGQIREIIPEESLIPGFNMFTKVVAFDMKTFTDPSSNQGIGNNIIAAMLMMKWAKGGNSSEFSLDNVTDDSFNGFGEYLPLIMATKNSGLSSIFTNPDGTPNMMMLMMMDGDKDSDGMMQMLVLSQLMGAKSPLSTFVDAVAPATANTTDAATLACEKCGATYSDPEIAFCTKCGGKTHSIQNACKKCGATLKPDAAFCHACGSKVSPAACIKCGKILDEGDAFCSACGASQIVTEPAPTEEQPAPNDSKTTNT